jgi:hypothetical protein
MSSRLLGRPTWFGAACLSLSLSLPAGSAAGTGPAPSPSSGCVPPARRRTSSRCRPQAPTSSSPSSAPRTPVASRCRRSFRIRGAKSSRRAKRQAPHVRAYRPWQLRPEGWLNAKLLVSAIERAGRPAADAPAPGRRFARGGAVRPGRLPRQLRRRPQCRLERCRDQRDRAGGEDPELKDGDTDRDVKPGLTS